MANDTNKYPHSPEAKDSVVVDLRDNSNVELVRSLHDVLEQLGSIAVERIATDSTIRGEVDTLLTEATRILELLPHDDTMHTHDENASSQGIRLVVDTPSNEAM